MRSVMRSVTPASAPDLIRGPGGARHCFTPPFQGRGTGWVRASARQKTPAAVLTVAPGASSPRRNSPTPSPSLEREGLVL